MKFRSDLREASVVIGKKAKFLLWLYRLDDNNRSELNGNNRNLNYNNRVRGMVFSRGLFNMNLENNLYDKICSFRNLFLAFKKARKRKTKMRYVKKFEENLLENLLKLQEELNSQSYKPKKLKTFALRDPKTRKISKSAFRDRVIHHSINLIIEPIFEKIFIYDSCANRKGKGTLFALKRFEKFQRKVTQNFSKEAFCFKADIRHYFLEVNHEILLKIIKRQISDEKTLELINKILKNGEEKEGVGMPLGNLTSQFFANVYLHDLDFFVKHRLKAKFYIRYVDDFVILHKSKEQLEIWKNRIEEFLKEKLNLELHPEKSKILSLSNKVDFVGFRNFYYFRLLRKRNIKNMNRKIQKFLKKEISREKIIESFQGWNAYAMWADSMNTRIKLHSNLLNYF